MPKYLPADDAADIEHAICLCGGDRCLCALMGHCLEVCLKRAYLICVKEA